MDSIVGHVGMDLSTNYRIIHRTNQRLTLSSEEEKHFFLIFCLVCYCFDRDVEKTEQGSSASDSNMPERRPDEEIKINENQAKQTPKSSLEVLDFIRLMASFKRNEHLLHPD